jgi:asparagine synthase (glutamine-hydrolysing)
MCGIAGIFAYGASAPPIDRFELDTIRESMAVRGPDGAGTWLSADGRIGLAHRRLAIIDLSETGAQPMASVDGSLHITFNGEIYNYKEIREELMGRGFRFRSTSDTEVLLNLYLDRGEAMVDCLRGMYTFAIWDDRHRSVLLARDPFGIKPLYYADDGKTVRFASQVKALLRGGRIPDTQSAAGHVGFYLWGSVPDPYTLYDGIRAVPAGSIVTIEPSGVRAPRQFFNVAHELAKGAEEAAGDRITVADAYDRVRVALKDSVAHHLVADVPVGVFLSSGIDSTTLTALCAEVGGGNLHTVTLGFDEYRGTRNDETPLAEVVARRFGTVHQTRWVSKTNFEAELPRLLDSMDQPSIDGVNTYFVSRAAAESGMKVALSGIGGDELFGSYPSFNEIPLIVGALGRAPGSPALGRGFRRVSSPVLRRMTSPKFAGLFEYGATYGGAYLLRRGLFMPWELPDILDPELVRKGWADLHTQRRLVDSIDGVRSSFQKVSALELSWYMRNQLLRDADWAGMAHSLEIRVPFVDVTLVRALAPLMAARRIQKTMVARAPLRPLPQEIAAKPKTGFSIPVRDWLHQTRSRLPLQRGLRSWAQFLNPPLPRRMRLLALATDAFGGHGGIAKFNRDLLQALCNHSLTKEVVAIPRLMVSEPEPLPAKLTYITAALNNKARFIETVLKVLGRREHFDIIFCCHIHLLPVAWLASLASGGKLILVVHGIDAWQPTRSTLTNRLARRVDAFIAVSSLTKNRFVAWSGIASEKGVVLPNSIDMAHFHPGEKNADLVRRYGLQGKTVVMTMGRLVSAERYKGFDEVLESMPQLVASRPNLVYMIIGDGNDRRRLQAKARDLGVESHVIFTGFIPEDEKRDHYNLADAFVMPSRGEGFGIVFLEAMACGVPVVASSLDGGREALRDGALGTLVDPNDAVAIREAIMAAVSRPRRVEEGLGYFSFDNFEKRVHKIVDEATA